MNFSAAFTWLGDLRRFNGVLELVEEERSDETAAISSYLAFIGYHHHLCLHSDSCRVPTRGHSGPCTHWSTRIHRLDVSVPSNVGTSSARAQRRR